MSQGEHFKDWDIDHWQYAHGQPVVRARFKSCPEDFIVTETLSYELSGEGENLYLLIEKESLNTQQVCQHLAKVFNRRLRDVGYAGLKDKHAITRQWFSIQMNVKQTPDLSGVDTEQIRLIKTVRHGRKLKVGSLKSNHFAIRLRSVTDTESLLERFNYIAEHGVPSYFGEQRFGFKGNNLNWANRMASGESIRDKKIKGFALSAARSFLFNEVLSRRLVAGYGNQPYGEEVFELAGSNSYFAEPLSADSTRRLAEQDIFLTGPLFGQGEMIATGEVLALETRVAEEFSDWFKLLADNGLKQERRALWLYPKKMTHDVEGDDVVVSFELPSGTFATSVIRECIRIIEDENSSQ